VLCAPGFPSSRDDSDKPFLLNHALALVSAGFDVTVVCPSAPGLPNRQTVEGIEVVRTRYAPRRFETLAATGSMYREARGFRSVLVVPMIAALTLAAIRESRKNNVIALHGHWWVPGGLVAVLASFFTRTQSVVHLHGSDSVVATNFFMRWLARRVIRSATHCLAVSEELADWGRELSSRNVLICPMPISDLFTKSDVPPPSDGPVLAVGRLVHEKGFDVLVEAVGQIDENERREIVIVGEGPEREPLAVQAESYGLTLNMPGALSPDEVRDWYQKASFVVVPSRREGFGLVAAEAAMSGRAVIGSRVGGIPDVIQHGVSGLIVEPGDIEGLMAAIQNIDVGWGLAVPKNVLHLGAGWHTDFLTKIYGVN
jgi:glycosyltransferase involved in cell wall biosynthesis